MKVTDGDLWVTFRLESGAYCIASEAVDSIVLPEALTPLPDAPDWCPGLLKRGGELVPIVEMRTLFHMPNLEQRAAEFGQMKEMHISWTESLRESVKTCVPFTKPVDPHRCKFGIWYDHFETENHSLKFILKKIIGPHERLHLCGAEINAMIARGDMASAAGRLEEAETICHGSILPLLDQLIAAYREANRGIVLVIRIGNRRAGLLVDEVTGLIPSARTLRQRMPGKTAGCLSEVILDGNHPYLCVDKNRLPFLAEPEKEPVS